ncbi:XRE family transcriptional regulator [Pandoraea pnomenusa]|uniref:Transcriptional regulator, y4mF family n=2 Tax=Burkholderiaceae TaxID=119060 RepID=A0A378YB61_9BURK|nr:XRE family transcriptional regulator [Pandoraea pnomenusa 3kgm]AHB77883.1 transcriptional regulator [Pandoraea pnomenusa]AHN73825.2 transcriptional regulator [Pandoraea pnomenusa]AIU25429.1 XRE family transcriptional regulator [Pandoraea pnomenusa]ANC46543.1 transcriptional regulator [Pandoraea pnomenusa]
MLIIMSFIEPLIAARKAAALTQAELADLAGLSRMTVQKVESGALDPRVSTVLEMARALGLEPMLVPATLRHEVEAFLRSGGKYLAQPSGVSAPPSIVETLAG